MKILFIDVYSSYLDLILRAKAWGHEVRWFQGKMKDGTHSIVGKELVDRVGDWESSMKWADLILLADNVKYITLLESYRRRGFPIFGPNAAVSKWELDRGVGQSILSSSGIPTIPTIPFTSIPKAREFLFKNLGRYVSKPNGEDNKALSYVSKSPRDLLSMFDRWERGGTVKGDFILQEFTPGVEVAVGGWFGKSGFSKYFLENFEHKKLMSGEIGVNTGEQGTVLRYTTESKLAEELLLPLEGELYRTGYTGYIDVAVMVGKGGRLNPLEFTCRPGWPLQQILQSLHKGDPVEWMKDSLEGRDTLNVMEGKVSVGVVITTPPFPSTPILSEVKGFPIYGWHLVGDRDFHPAEVMAGDVWECDDKGCWKELGLVTAGAYVCVITGVGETVEEASKECYKNVGLIELPNSPMYRDDIGERLFTQLPLLQKWGYCKGWA